MERVLNYMEGDLDASSDPGPGSSLLSSPLDSRRGALARVPKHFARRLCRIDRSFGFVLTGTKDCLCCYRRRSVSLACCSVSQAGLGALIRWDLCLSHAYSLLAAHLQKNGQMHHLFTALTLKIGPLALEISGMVDCGSTWNLMSQRWIEASGFSIWNDNPLPRLYTVNGEPVHVYGGYHIDVGTRDIWGKLRTVSSYFCAVDYLRIRRPHPRTPLACQRQTDRELGNVGSNIVAAIKAENVLEHPSDVTLPEKYSDFSDVFSKSEANKWPPHSAHDLAIEVSEGKISPFGPR